MKNIFYIFILLISLNSCNYEKLDLNYFNKPQKELLKMLLQKNDSILKQNYKLPIYKAYFKQIKKLDSSKKASDISNNIFLKDSLFINKLFNTDIFYLTKVKTYNSEHEELVYYLNMKGNYLIFLKHISSENKAILKYYNSLISAGNISPASTKILLHSLTKEDLKSENIRLIVSINFLLINNS